MTDSRSFMILGKSTPDGLVWFDDIRRRDNIHVNDLIYLAGKAYHVKPSAVDRNGRFFSDVTDAFMDAEVAKFDAAYDEYLAVDETYAAVRESTR